jgi:hypothetical protein
MFRHFELSLSLFTLIDTSHYFLHKAHFNVMVNADKTVNISIALCWSQFKASTRSSMPLLLVVLSTPFVLLSALYFRITTLRPLLITERIGTIATNEILIT